MRCFMDVLVADFDTECATARTPQVVGRTPSMTIHRITNVPFHHWLKKGGGGLARKGGSVLVATTGMRRNWEKGFGTRGPRHVYRWIFRRVNHKGLRGRVRHGHPNHTLGGHPSSILIVWYASVESYPMNRARNDPKSDFHTRKGHVTRRKLHGTPIGRHS